MKFLHSERVSINFSIEIKQSSISSTQEDGIMFKNNIEKQ